MNSTSGEASIAGYDILNERRQIYRVLGICPQFDVLWGDLTVQEHLLLYARLNGIPTRLELARARQVAEQVGPRLGASDSLVVLLHLVLIGFCCCTYKNVKAVCNNQKRPMPIHITFSGSYKKLLGPYSNLRSQTARIHVFCIICLGVIVMLSSDG